MSTGPISGIDRRDFLKTGMAGAAGLAIGFYLPGRFEALAASPAGAAPASLNAWMLISPDDTVKIMIDKSGKALAMSWYSFAGAGSPPPPPAAGLTRPVPGLG